MAEQLTIDELQIEISADSVNAAAELDKLAQSLQRLLAPMQSIAGSNGLGQISRQLRQLAEAAQAISSMPVTDTTGIESLGNALSALETDNARNISQTVNALSRLPEAARQVSQIDFAQFEQSLQQLTASITPLLDAVTQAGTGLNSLAQITAQGQNNVGRLPATLGNLSVRSLISTAALMKLKSVLADCFNVSAQYVENLNLFNVTMGDTALTAFEFAESVNEALGVDVSDWTRYQGFFQSVGKGFGVVSEKADLMSQNLTQLSYDISSFYNLSVDEAYNKVQSGFSGELEPLRRLGFALDEATLKQLAYSKGVTQSYESMTQAQKSQLRYIAMIEQAQSIGVTGDMSRTIDTASNNLRVLNARLQQFARAVGNLITPLLSELLPYMTAFMQVVTDAANALASLVGFELPELDLGGISNGYDDIAAAAEEASAATDKFKGSLAGVDQLNIIGSKSSTTDGSGTGYSTDLDIDLPTYDFLNGVESRTKEIAENMKNWFKEALPWIEAVGAAVTASFAASSVLHLADQLIRLRSIMSTLGSGFSARFRAISGGLAAGASSGVLLYNSLKNIITGTGNLANSWVQLGSGIAIAGTAITAFIAASNPLGAIITAIGALTGAILGVKAAIDQTNKAMGEAIMYSHTGGAAVDEFADCYSGMFSTLASGYQGIVDTSAAIDANRLEAQNAATEIHNLTDKYIALGGEMTAEDAEAIKNNLETIGKAVSENLGSYTQQIVDTLKTKFSDLARSIGADVESMTSSFYLLENLGNTALAKTRQEADSIVDKISAGTASQQDYSRLNELTSQMAEVNTHTAEQEALNRAFGNVTNGSLDFSSQEQVTSAIEEISEAARTARETIEAARNGQLADISNYKDTLTNLGVNAEYDEIFGTGSFEKLFSDTKTVLETGYANELEKIDLMEKSGLGAIYKQFQENLEAAFNAEGLTASDWAYASGAVWEYSTPYAWLNPEKRSAVAEKHKANSKDERIAEIAETQFGDIYSLLEEKGFGKSGMEYYSEIGGYITEGIANGVIDGEAALSQALNILADDGKEAFKNALGIHSPSTVFKGYGEYITAGLANGIEAGENDVMTAIDAVAENISDFNAKFKTGSFSYGTNENTANNQTSEPNGGSASGDTTIILEIDGEKIAEYFVDARNRELAMSNGR